MERESPGSFSMVKARFMVDGVETIHSLPLNKRISQEVASQMNYAAVGLNASLNPWKFGMVGNGEPPRFSS